MSRADVIAEGTENNYGQNRSRVVNSLRKFVILAVVRQEAQSRHLQARAPKSEPTAKNSLSPMFSQQGNL